MKYPNQIIKINTKNPTVIKAVKKVLVSLGYNLDIQNPNFGTITENFVKDFQRKNGLKADGQIGLATWNKLFPETQVINNEGVSELAQKAIETLLTQKGVKETTGKNDGPEIKKYLESVGLWEGLAYCMALMYWGFDEASKELNITNPLKKTGGVLDQYNSRPNNRVNTPQRGDIFIMDFGGGKGHAGIVLEVRGNRILTFEGNTSADPNSAHEDREGQGNYERSRLISSINKKFLRF